MAVRDDRSDVKQTTAGFRGPLMVQSLTSAKSKFLSLNLQELNKLGLEGMLGHGVRRDIAKRIQLYLQRRMV